MDKKGQKDQKTILIYSESFKQKVVKEVEDDKITISQAQKKYDIKSSATIRT